MVGAGLESSVQFVSIDCREVLSIDCREVLSIDCREVLSIDCREVLSIHYREVVLVLVKENELDTGVRSIPDAEFVVCRVTLRLRSAAASV